MSERIVAVKISLPLLVFQKMRAEGFLQVFPEFSRCFCSELIDVVKPFEYFYFVRWKAQCVVLAIRDPD